MDNLFFDLDGTISDPQKGIINSLEYALDQIGTVLPPEQDLTWCIGPPLLESLIKITGTLNNAERALIHFRDRYSEVGLYENSLYNRVAEGLDKLSNSGRSLFIVTSKPKPFADSILSHFKVDKYFKGVFGTKLNGSFSDKSHLLAHALSVTNSQPDRSIMIGDRKYDIIAARKNLMNSIGVLYGFGSQDELESAGASQLVNCPEALFKNLSVS